MTDDELLALCSAATPGPWHEYNGSVAYDTGKCNCGTQGGPYGHEPGCSLDLLAELGREKNPDSTFIAAFSPDVGAGLIRRNDHE